MRIKGKNRVTAFLFIVLLIAAGVWAPDLKVTYSVNQLDPVSLRDLGWSALESTKSISGCAEIDMETLRDTSFDAVRDPSLLDGGDLWTVKRVWCDARHVQIFITHYRNDFKAWNRMRAWNGEDAKRIHSGSESRFDDIALREHGVTSFQGREWSMCTARFRMGNYLLDYRLDVSGEPKTCEAMAQRDVESMREGIDTWMKSGQPPLLPN